MRKPNPGLAYNLAIKNNIILLQCVAIGSDEHLEEMFANNCGMHSFDVETFLSFYSTEKKHF